MGLDDLEALVEVLLHGFMVDQVLLELLGQLCAEDLQVLNLFGGFIPDFENFFIDVSTEEVSSLR